MVVYDRMIVLIQDDGNKEEIFKTENNLIKAEINEESVVCLDDLN